MAKKVFVGIVVVAFSLVSGHLFAQTPWLSKDVQKVANKDKFQSEEYINAGVRAVSVSNDWVSSKGVSNIGRAESPVPGNIRSTGTPQWTISKGVQQTKVKNPAVEKQNEEFRMGPEITGKGN